MINTRRFSDHSVALLLILATVFAAAGTVRAADIAQVILESEGTSIQSNVPVTFGHVFRRGEVPAGTGLEARFAGGGAIPIQVDRKATHVDGSLRHAVITLQAPTLNASESRAVVLGTASLNSSASAPTIAQALAAGVDAVVSLNVGGTVYSASAATMLQGGQVRQWLSGPLVSEWIVGGPVRTAGGTAHPHLTAYFHVRYYAVGRARIDVVVENGWTFVSGPNRFTYDATITVPGAGVAYSRSAIPHHTHARWHRIVWWGGESRVYPRLDTEYLQSTKAVPNYKDLTPTASRLNSMISGVEPMGIGNLRTYWGGGGAHPQIGPLPEWTALYLISGDRRAWRAMLANSDALGAFSLHYRNENTGYMPAISDYPTLNITLGTLLPSASGRSPHDHDRAHQPSTSYVPYLVTGDYFHLEELQYLANYNLIFAAPNKRNSAAGEFVRDQDYEVRGHAWGLRTLAHAAYATPDDHPLKAYFSDRVVNNLRYLEQAYVNNQNYVARHLGLVPDTEYGKTQGPWSRVSYWMQAFLGWTLGHLVELDFPAEAAAEWKAIWTAGIMGPDHCFQIAPVNREHVFDPANQSRPVNSFAALWARHPAAQAGAVCNTQGMANWLTSNPPEYSRPSGRSFRVGEIVYAIFTDSYYANLQPALAAAVDLGVAGPEAWQKWTVVNTTIPDYHNDPTWAIEPRSEANAVGKPIISLSASPNPVAAGGNVELSWTALNASSCSASGGWAGARAVSGTATAGPVNTAVTFTLNCSGEGGVTQAAVQVTLAAAGGGGNNGSDTGGGSGDDDGITAEGYVWDTLAVGQRVYVDRNFTYSTVPGGYVGLSYLQTRNDDKFVAGDGFIAFSLADPAAVFVAYDTRLSERPAWLNNASWADTGHVLVTTDTTLRLYRRDYPAGQVSLGGNQNGGSMYTVVVSALQSAIIDETPPGGGTGNGNNGGAGSGNGGSGGSNPPQDNIVGSDSGSESSGSAIGSADPLMILLLAAGIAIASRRRAVKVVPASQ